MTVLNPEKVISLIKEETLSYLRKYNKDKVIVKEFISIDLLFHKIYEAKTSLRDLLPTDLDNDNEDNNIIFSSLTKEIIDLKIYPKHGINSDFAPFGDLFTSEVKELAEYLNFNLDWNCNSSEEWLVRSNEQFNWFSTTDPTKHKMWGGLTSEQRDLVSKYWSRHPFVQHKKLIPYVIPIRHITGLVR